MIFEEVRKEWKNMKTIRLTKEHTLAQIKYESSDGIHTYTTCRCGRQGCRGSRCLLCWKEKLEKINGAENDK